MDRRLALIVLGGVLTAVVLVAAATAGEVRLVDGPPTINWNVELAEPDAPPPPQITIPEPADTDVEPVRIPTAVSVLLQILTIAAVGALIVLAVRHLWRNRPRLRWRRSGAHDDFAVLDDLAASVRADAAAQRAALQHGVPRNAIVECWLRLEGVIAEAGLPREPADTSVEYTERVLSHYPIDPTAIRELAALYREARFSTHSMDEAARRAAIEALDAVHAGIADHALEPDATAVPTP